jgi:DNA gyrase subunit A
VALIDEPSLSVTDLMSYVPGPDFPTAGLINGVSGVHDAYRTGRGRVHIRARTSIESVGESGKQAIIVTEIPYQVNKARLIEKIAELVRDKKIEGITELRDESDKDGMRVVIELRRGEVPEVVLNNLFKHTPLESVFGINIVALVDGQPRLLNLKQLLEAFLRHRREVVTRRTIFDLRKARDRAHVLEGLAVALANIDEVIQMIKSAGSPAEARRELVVRDWAPGAVTAMLERAGVDATRPEGLDSDRGLHDGVYRLSEIQAQAILDLRLHRLTGLEQEKLVNEFRDLIDKIKELSETLADPSKLLSVIRGELEEVRDQFGDERRTEIIETQVDLTLEDLIPEEDRVVTFSHGGYAKSQPLDTYQAQRRGGRGKSATRMKEEDFIEKLFVANSHDTLLCFSTHGKVYWLKVYQLPQAGRGSRGRPIVNLLPLESDERITAVLPIREYSDDQYVFMATASGTVKKTALSAFSRPRASGIIAVDLRGDDELVDVAVTDGDRDIMLFATSGKAIRFRESDVRAMGRTAAGVRGIRLDSGHRVIALIIVGEGDILTATAHGFGKRTPVSEYPVKGRGGKGVISIQTTERNGNVVGALQVCEGDEVVLISGAGTLVRTPIVDISVVGRNTQGVTLIRLDDKDSLVGLDAFQSEDVEDED